MTINDFEYVKNLNGFTITGYNGKDLNLVIPEGVIEIAKDAFTGKPIKSIVFPKSLKLISDGAFYYCENLKSVTFASDSVLEEIDEYAFGCCFSLKKIAIPKSVKLIRLGAFDGCESLTEASLYDSVQIVKAEAFRCCDELKQITIFGNTIPTTWQNGWHEEGVKINIVNCEKQEKKPSVAKNYNGVKNFCRLDEFIVENTKYGFKIIAPKNKDIKDLVIPAEVTEIADKAFFECLQLESVIGHENLRIIGKDAFCNCRNLIVIYIDKNTAVLSGAFKGCVSLEGVCVSKNMQSAVFANSGVKEVEFIDDIDTIPEFLFYNCPIQSIKLPDSVQFIMTCAFANSKLKSIKFGKNLSNIWSKAFYNCTMLESVVIPNDVRYIMEQTFCGCKALKKVDLNGITEIRSGAFKDCVALKEITIPKTVLKVNKDAFSGYLKRVEIVQKTPKNQNSTTPEGWDEGWINNLNSETKIVFKN